MTVVWKTRDGADAEDELAALSARVGDGDRNLHSEFIARARLAFGDAFDPRRMQSMDFVLVMRQELLDPFQFSSHACMRLGCPSILRSISRTSRPAQVRILRRKRIACL